MWIQITIISEDNKMVYSETAIPTVASKDAERAELNARIELFLANGGKIKQIPLGVCSKEPDGLSKSTKAKLNCK